MITFPSSTPYEFVKLYSSDVVIPVNIHCRGLRDIGWRTSLKGCVLAKTVTDLLTLCLASAPLGFTVVAEPGFGWATPVVFCCFWGRLPVSLLAALDRGCLAQQLAVPEWPYRPLMEIMIHSVRVAGKNRVKVA